MFQIAVKGDGALRGCTVIVNGRGEAKGFVGCPELSDEFTLEEAVGKGTLQVKNKTLIYHIFILAEFCCGFTYLLPMFIVM